MPDRPQVLAIRYELEKELEHRMDKLYGNHRAHGDFDIVKDIKELREQYNAAVQAVNTFMYLVS